MGGSNRGPRESFAAKRPGGNEAYQKDKEKPITSYQTEVNDYLQERLSNEINQKDTETINARKEEILKTLKDEFDAEDVSTGGSYSKHTYVNGLSDVDILIKLGRYSNSSIPNKENSKEVLNFMAKELQERYPRTKIEVGKMAITMKFSDGTEIQILPAFSYHNGYRVPDPDSNGWVCTYPDRFKQKLTAVNQNNNGKVKPVIKLVKECLNNNNVPIKSYHLENIAVEAFENYDGSYTYSEMTLHLLRIAKKKVLNKIPDESCQSDHVDEYLGDSRSKNRKQLSKKIGELEEKLSNCDTKDEWKSVLDGS